MSSLTTLQVVTLVPADELPDLRAAASQPRGKHPRRKRDQGYMNELVQRAWAVHSQGHITKKAYHFLAGWATETKLRVARPVEPA